MKIGIISGSHRNDSQSEKIARYALGKLEKHGLCYETYLFSLADNPLPFWDEGLWNGDPKWEEAIGELRDELNSCDGFIVVTPEWHGMVPSGLKNLFLLFPGSGELAHKPALIVAVSGGAGGGAYPVAELRMSSYKNSRICYLPEHLIVRNAGMVFNEDSAENDDKQHDYLDARLTYCLEMLGEYTKAFQQIRASGKTSLEEYTNGM
ncbi:NADPH-dependent FMN reductase [Congregibacter litoralis]|uniref:Putative flavoprotein n=1 Tax=Congregibacter litoralis KT71 TaxID=314285 RepID=A4A911_9GAMM|nr:NAD(P)H-dependent oxidoreductase [Congregibacter litoralis]EAQ97553.1 putative flavoprotein [Congregibacter litoralis KT71]